MDTLCCKVYIFSLGNRERKEYQKTIRVAVTHGKHNLFKCYFMFLKGICLLLYLPVH